MYSTKRAYIIARPWVLSIVSLTIINPDIQRVQLYLTHSQCAGRVKNDRTLSRDISTALKGVLHPTDVKEIGVVV